jgi:hypothetical protein
MRREARSIKIVILNPGPKSRKQGITGINREILQKRILAARTFQIADGMKDVLRAEQNAGKYHGRAIGNHCRPPLYPVVECFGPGDGVVHPGILSGKMSNDVFR